MKESTGQKKSRWFWAGVVLLSLSGLFLFFLGIVAEPGEVRDTILGGLLFAFIPIAAGIGCLVSTMVTPTGKKPADPEMVRAAMDAMKDVESQQVIASYKVGLLNKLEITDKGIRTKKVNIPYGLIKECNCYRNQYGVPDRCGIDYLDQSGQDRHIEFGGSALKIYSEILWVSKQHGYRISQRPHGKLHEWAKQLQPLSIQSEFMEPSELIELTQGPTYWQRHLGGLKFRGSHIDTVQVREEGEITKTSGAGRYGGSTTTEVHTLYYFDYVIQIEPTPNIACSGNPVRKFPRRMVDYCWYGGELAQKPKEGMTLRDVFREAGACGTETREERKSRWAADFGYKEEVVYSTRERDKCPQSLSEDTQLCKMLIKAKAPAIEVKGNHIRMQDKRFPSLELFQCIDTIAGYVRKEAK